MLLDEAKEYYTTDKNISQDFVGNNKASYIKEVSDTASLKELAEVLNRYLFKTGNKFYIVTI